MSQTPCRKAVPNVSSAGLPVRGFQNLGRGSFGSPCIQAHSILRSIWGLPFVETPTSMRPKDEARSTCRFLHSYSKQSNGGSSRQTKGWTPARNYSHTYYSDNSTPIAT